MIISNQGMKPKLHPAVFVAEGAQIIEDVEIGRDSSVGFNTVIRGDVHYIRVGGQIAQSARNYVEFVSTYRE